MTSATVRRAGLLAAAITVSAVTLRAQSPALLAPARQRITSEIIARDFAVLDHWTRRADSLPHAVAPALRYQRAKATLWMRFASDEYADNERGPVVAEALARAAALVEATENGRELVRDDVALPGTSPVRSDLHSQLRVHVRRGLMTCAPELIAELEVMLLTAAHAPGPVGRANAAAALQRAETADLQLTALSCTASADTSPRTPVAADAAPVMPARDSVPAAPAAPVVRVITLPRVVHFGFGRSRLSPATQALLDDVVTALREVTATRIVLTGHTDRHGPSHVNARLALRRAHAVRRYLIAHGMIDPALVTVRSAASREPADAGRSHRADALNRRVELQIEATDSAAMRLQDTDRDLQPRRR